MEDFKKELNFESDTFSNVKRDMNFVLQRLLGNMQEKGATEGSMTLKIDVSFDTAYIPNYDPNIEGESRRIEKPKFVHKVTSAVQIKDEKKCHCARKYRLNTQKRKYGHSSLFLVFRKSCHMYLYQYRRYARP